MSAFSACWKSIYYTPILYVILHYRPKEANLLGLVAVLLNTQNFAHCYRPTSVVCRSVTVVRRTKSAEPIEMPFVLRIRMSRRNRVYAY